MTSLDHPRRAAAAAVLALIALSACGHMTDPVICTTIGIPGLAVAVTDSLSGAGVTGASLLAVSGAYRDSSAVMLPGADGPVLYAVYERAGTYDLTVRAPGYRDWTRGGVVVTGDACHVTTVRLTARLQK